MPLAREESLRVEVLVIGSGAGGAPVAAALATAGREVCVLESGPRLGMDERSGHEGELLRRLMKARSVPSSGMELYAGACVGGSTVVNDALCWRTPPEVLQAWRREHGLTNLTATEFAFYVDRIWKDIHAEPTGRKNLNRNAHRMEVGAARLGWSAQAMARNVKGCVNLGLCNLGCPSGAKQSMARSYLPQAEQQGARLLDRVRAERIEFVGEQVRAVEALRLDPASGAPIGRLRIEAEQVCVAAGVLETPALLLRSGLGGGGSPLGQGLQFHSSAYVTARFSEPVHGYYGPTMSYAVTEFADVNGHSGPGFMLENVTTAQATTAGGLPGFGTEHERVMRALPYLARCVVVLRDRTRGSVRVDDEGTAQIRYDPLSEDLRTLKAGLRAAARCYLASGADEVYLPVNGLAPVRSESDLAALDALELDPRRTSLLYAVHLFGGAAMGGSHKSATCDPDGAVWGRRGLFVSDASALPSNTGVNPQVTIMANALRVARRMANPT